ncbi:MAG: hypothetical protein RI964_2768 [Pseudomonadota bacterium]|jgi:hypothetical protein
MYIPNEQELKQALLLLEDVHQHLLATHNYGTDLLVYRAIQCLNGKMPEGKEEHHAGTAFDSAM